MKTKLLRSLMLITLLSIGTHVFAHDFEIGGICYNITSSTDKTVAVTYKGANYEHYNEYTGNVTIPETVTYNGTTYSVTSIGNWAFSYCSGFTNVTIPNTVTSIGYYAFYNTGWYNNQPDGILYLDSCCLGYKGKMPAGNLTLKDDTRLIADRTFTHCIGLTSVTIPESVTTIGNGAFWGCSGLTTITIPNFVTSIGNRAFYECIGLTSVTIGESVKIIGEYAFYHCTGLTSVTIPNSVTTIENCAFWGCSDLTSVTIGESVKTIGSSVFRNCSVLNEIVVKSGNSIYDSRDNCNAIIDTVTNTLIIGCKTTIIPNSVTSIGERVFQDCSGLTSVTIPNSVTTIGGSAFYSCSGLTLIVVESGNTVYDSRDNCNAIIETATNTLIVGCKTTIIPNSVTSIGEGAFLGCDSLTSITIPESVTIIRNSAFSLCRGLTNIILLNPTPPICETSVFGRLNTQNIQLIVPIGSESAYKSADTWKDFANIIGKDLSGVDETLADDVDAPAEYYDFNGVRVENPEKGVYIKRKGYKTTKVVL